MQSGPVSAQPVLDLFSGPASVDAGIKIEQIARHKNAENPLGFGVSFLDEALGGIYTNDLILIGAATGFGKTQLATLIAIRNSVLNHRVLYLALEAEPQEIARRIKYQLISDAFFSIPAPTRPSIRLNYMDWYYGKFKLDLAEMESRIESIPEIFPTMRVFYRDGDFGATEFEKLLIEEKDRTDLFIVDHLHYFDLDTANENAAMKSLVKKIRDVSLLVGKPVILLAHVRKADKRAKQLMPDIEDFHGSSDIGKIATKAISLAPNYEISDARLRSTYMRILKCRVDGSRTTSTAMTTFNFATQRYEQGYAMGKLSSDGTVFEPLSAEGTPPWAIHARPLILR